ncbi:MAG: galactokinase [Clostridia bacterium]|nr:galactokinase [Clostridia bacterium]
MDAERYYGENADRQAIEKRYLALEERMKAKGTLPERFFSSSGRAEILGNHTDHQHGKVIVSAISCDIIAGVAKRSDRMIEICSEGFYPIRFSLDDLSLKTGEVGKSVAMAKGVAKNLTDRGYTLGGFTAYTDSCVFRGAGVSSSAAFEVLIAEIFNDLYLEGRLTAVDKAAIGQYAESEYFGKPCGLLDQSGVAYGGMNLIDFKVPSSPVSERLAPPPGYSIVITNTGGSHSALTEHYAAIKNEMKSVAAYFGKEALRHVYYREFIDGVAGLKKVVSERAILRAFHFFDENRRVEIAARALKENHTGEFLRCVEESGDSSVAYLQNAFVPGSDRQPILLGVKLSKRLIRDGAVRLHGGGFAGTVLAILAEKEEERYVSSMAKIFGAENVFRAKIRPSGAERVDR